MFASCDKSMKQPLNYSVSDDAAASGFYDIYIPDTGAYTLPALVKFLSGYPQDSVKLVISGLPAGVTVSPDTFSAIPTYTENFVFSTKHMAQGTYPVTLTAYTPTQASPRAYNFNIVVVPANAAALFAGSLSDSNACTARNYKFSATGSIPAGTKNQLTINNFGGYGSNVDVSVFFNEQTDSLYIPNQTAGNGSTLSGYGTFTNTKMVIYYTATSTPTNPAENCTAIFTK